MTSAAGDTDSAEAAAASQLAAAIATAVVALGAGQLIAGVLVAKLTASPDGTRELVGRAIELTLVAAPILLLALADGGQLRVRAPLEVAKLAGCAAVTLAFEAVYDSFSGGVPSPLVTLPLLLTAVTGALVAARWLSPRLAVAASRPPS
jgi:hypothetical protein